MIAGRLNEIIDIYSPTEVINAYGERDITYQKTYSTRARVDYSGGSRNVENDETVFNYYKTFNVRYYVPIVEACQIEWQGKRYRILTVEKRREFNDIIINTELIND